MGFSTSGEGMIGYATVVVVHVQVLSQTFNKQQLELFPRVWTYLRPANQTCLEIQKLETQNNNIIIIIIS